MVRDGHHRPRTVTTAAGSVAWCRKSPKVSEVLPLLYLRGLSSGNFVPALEQFLGSAAGLSPATVTRLTKQWSDDRAAFQQRDLAESDYVYVYVWADGVHPKVRLGQAHSCVLVLMGVRLDDTKELIALAEGLRESTDSWADLLHDCSHDPVYGCARAWVRPHAKGWPIIGRDRYTGVGSSAGTEPGQHSAELRVWRHQKGGAGRAAGSLRGVPEQERNVPGHDDVGRLPGGAPRRRPVRRCPSSVSRLGPAVR